MNWYSCHLCSYSTNAINYYSRHLVCHDTFTKFAPGENVVSLLTGYPATVNVQDSTYLCFYCCYNEESLQAMRQHRDKCHPYNVFDCTKITNGKTEVLVDLQPKLLIEDICQMDLMRLATKLMQEGVRMKSSNENESYCVTNISHKNPVEELAPQKKKKKISIFTKSKLMKYKSVTKETQLHTGLDQSQLHTGLDQSLDTFPYITKQSTSESKGEKGDNANLMIEIKSEIATNENEQKGDNSDMQKVTKSFIEERTIDNEERGGNYDVKIEPTLFYGTNSSKNEEEVETSDLILCNNLDSVCSEDKLDSVCSDDKVDAVCSDDKDVCSDNKMEVKISIESREQTYVSDQHKATHWPDSSSLLLNVVEISSDSEDESFDKQNKSDSLSL